MAKIVGSIGPAADIRRAPAFTEPSETIELSDATGRLHGRVTWVASEMSPRFKRALLELYAAALDLDEASIPASAS